MNHFIIDGLNLAYRAHNVNYDLKTAKGSYSGMFFGFLRIIFSLKKKYRGYKFHVVWDRKPLHKIALQPDYKAGRSNLSDTIYYQVDDIQKFLSSINVDQHYMKAQEADDVIATLCNNLKKDSDTIIVYSNDKDLLQLVEDGKVIVLKPKVGVNPEKFYDEEMVKDQFGVLPSKLACYRSFDGDNSDNITGINRVLRKKIAQLVNEYNTIDNIYKALPEESLTDFQRKSFNEFKDKVYINIKIIELNKNLDKIIHKEGSINKDFAEELLKKYEIKSINLNNMVDLFSSSLNIKYTTPMDKIEIKSFSLFD
jgi:DNA polymerase I